MSAEQKIVELESKVAFMERLLDEMNQILYKQQKEMDLLKKQLSQTQGKIKDIEQDNGSSMPADERPPHY